MTTPMSIGLRINGATRPASDGAWAIRKNPVTGDVVTRSAAATLTDADAAVEAAANAFPVWSELDQAHVAASFSRPRTSFRSGRRSLPRS